MTGRTICIALDDSDTSEHAFTWYIQNFHKSGDTLILSHVHQMPQLPAMGLMGGSIAMSDSFQDVIDASVRKSKSIISKFKSLCDTHSIKHKEVLVDDYHSPGHMICEVAKKHSADAIVTGQRGLGAIGRVFIGSTSDYVLHHAHIPVCVIPPQQKS